MNDERMRAGASALAAEVHDAETEEKRRSWRKVTTVLSLLGVSRLTPAVREAAGQALAEAGLDCEPGMESVPRSGTVRLSTQATTKPAPRPQGAVVAEPRRPIERTTAVLSAAHWIPRTQPEDYAAEYLHRRPLGGVLLIEANPSSDVDDAYEVLRTQCGDDLTREMVDDLLEADEVSKVRIEPGWNTRMVSTFGVRVRDEQSIQETGEADVSGSKAGTVFFEVVEFVIGPDWVLTCWHNAAKLLPGGGWTDSASTLRDDVMARVAKQWPISGESSASDLATLIGTEMARTHILAQEEMSQWLEAWETVVSDPAQLETATLDSLRRALREYRRRMQALDLSRHTAPDGRWFSADGADHEQRMRSLVGQALRSLEAIGQSVRSGSELVAMNQMGGEQLRLSNEAQRLAREAQDAATLEQKRTERFQNTLTILGAILLGPGLIAAIYGANVDLPGRDHLAGTIILVIGMLVVSFLSIAIVRRIQRG